jgi:tetratricopeptide (TPR) repeat protein
MLETVREVGLERLEERGETGDLRRHHAAWSLDLAERAAPHVYGPDELEWLAVLDQEHANLRAALTWAAEAPAAETLVRLAAALWQFWYARGHLAEGLRWLREAVAAPGPVAPGHRARAAAGAAWMEHFAGDDGAARGLGEEALADARAAGDQRAAATAHYALGKVAVDGGAYDEAQGRFGAALALFREADDLLWVGLTLNHLGVVAFGRGDHAAAEATLNVALAVHRSVGHEHAVAVALLYLGHLALAQGDPAHASARYRESIKYWQQEGFRPGLVEGISGMAAAAEAGGRAEDAAVLFGAADCLRTSMGLRTWQPERDLYRRAIHAAQSALPPDRFAAAWERGGALTLDEAVATALRGDGRSIEHPELPPTAAHGAPRPHRGPR